MLYIESYGQIDGDHHKAWVLDQVARILMGTQVESVMAKWDDGHQEERFSTGEPSAEYKTWVNEARNDGYDYYEGIAP